jgi:hypothetical protein
MCRTGGNLVVLIMRWDEVESQAKEKFGYFDYEMG